MGSEVIGMVCLGGIMASTFSAKDGWAMRTTKLNNIQRTARASFAQCITQNANKLVLNSIRVNSVIMIILRMVRYAKMQRKGTRDTNVISNSAGTQYVTIEEQKEHNLPILKAVFYCAVIIVKPLS